MLEEHNQQITQLKLALAKAEREKEVALADKRREVTGEISTRLAALEKEFQAIKKLGESVEIVVYFSSGYEEFTYTDQEDWSSSSQHC